jgi:chromosome segregation ATPase
MFGINVNFSAGVETSSSVRSHSVATSTRVQTSMTTTTTTSSSSTYEVKIKEQYESKVSGYEMKMKELNSQMSTYETTVKTSETKVKEYETKIVTIRNELNQQIIALQRERDMLVNEKGSMSISLEQTKKESTNLRLQLTDYENRFRQMQERLTFLEGKNSEKNTNLHEMESKLLHAQQSIEFKLNEDVGQEEQIKKQREMIINLTALIEKLRLEDAAEDIKFAEMEMTIRQRSDEVTYLKKECKDYEDRLKTAKASFVVEETTIYQELETRYQDTINERDQLSVQLVIKSNSIKDLENRNHTLSNKITNLNKSVEELKIKVDTFERRELDLNRAISELEMKINIQGKESQNKDIKIQSLESILKTKNQNIDQLAAQIKSSDEKIKNLTHSVTEENSKVMDLQRKLQDKIREIEQWKKEDSLDNAQIASLMKAVKEQNEVIRSWEEENARDDKMIASLKMEIQQKELVIGRLKECILKLDEKFAKLKESAFSLELSDEKIIKEKIVSISSQITSSQQYIALETKFSEKEAETRRLHEEIFKLKKLVAQANENKNSIYLELQRCQDQLSSTEKSLVSMKESIVTYQSKMTATSQRFESESHTTVIAHTKVGNYKRCVQQASAEVEALYKEIEEYLV